MKKMKYLIIIAAAMIVLPQTVLSQMEHKMPSGESKTADGIKAAMVVTPSKNMVDLMLSDSKTGKIITGAKVFAKIKEPDGKAQEKELMGMQMGEIFSYMSMVDMARKGSYIFDITVEFEKKKVQFNFIYEVKK